MANLGEIHDPVRIYGGKKIIFGSRSASDALDWDCSCGATIKFEKKLIFTLPGFRCKCGIEFDGEIDFCLANVKANGISLVGEIKQQEVGESECIPYALSSTLEIMHNTHRALSSRSPQTKSCTLSSTTPHIKSSYMETSVFSIWYKNRFPGLKKGLHKLIHICQKIRKEGVYFKGGEYYQVGKTRIIYCDNFEKICRLIADGIPVLASLTTGNKYVNLQYCQLYKAVPAAQPRLQKFFTDKAEGGHMLCLIGAVQRKDGQRGFYGLDAAGELFCPQFVTSPDDIGVVPTGGVVKVNADSDFQFNFLAFARKEDREDDEQADDVDLIDEHDDATEASMENRMTMVKGEYFIKQLTAVKEQMAVYIPAELLEAIDI